MRDLDVPVRAHLLAGVSVLAAAMLLAALGAAGAFPPAAATPLLALAGMTLFLSGIAFWYLPSFAKRAVTPRFLARAVPWIGGFAALASALHAFASALGAGSFAAQAGAAATALGCAILLATFAGVLVLSVLLGPPWRGGEPFWRKEGPFRAGDGAALVGFASAAAWFAVAAGLLAGRPLRPFEGPAVLAWVAGLLTFTLAGLVHLLPRGRGAPLPAPLVHGGFLLLDAGVLVLATPRAPAWGALGLAAGLLALVAALGLEGRGRGKPPGPRVRQARPPLAAAGAILLTSALLLAALPWRPHLAIAAHGGLLAGAMTALGALSLLTLPVLLNQKPDGRFVLPFALAAAAGYALFAGGTLVDPTLTTPGVLLLALSLLLWLAALAPLRRPRRECPPGEE